MHDVIIIGSGPSALLAATVLGRAGLKVSLFEKRPSLGWKLLVAGSSGLNVSYDAEDLSSFYSHRRQEIAACLAAYPREQWLQLLTELQEEPFLGTSRRYFIKNKKASLLLQNWAALLESLGVTFHFNESFQSFETGPEISVKFASGRVEKTRTLLLALGGASWENAAPEWPTSFAQMNISCAPFVAANAGYHLKASKEFFLEAEGKPIKGLTLKTAKGEKQGELMITRYGLEGTPIYSLGCPGPAFLDLKPDLSAEKLWDRIRNARGTPLQKLEFGAKLSAGAIQLLKHLVELPRELDPSIANLLKNFPIELLDPRPLSESISSSGGLVWDELNGRLELKKAPGVFCAGEMVDWDAPTGGFLIQACVSMGFVAAQGIQERLRS